MVHKTVGTLYIVATPIGNMGDITLRAIETLKSVDSVVCEDTRVTGLLLHKLEIKKPMKALHQHSLESSINEIIEMLGSGRDVAYVTDNGTPGISDPGQRLVAEIRKINSRHPELVDLPAGRQGDFQNILVDSSLPQNDILIIPIPGASAVAAAVSVSGLVEKEFYFAGFLPKKKGRQTEFKYLVTIKAPIVIYESAFRIEKTLSEIKEYFGDDCQVFLAREMTKMFEEYWGGKIGDVLANFKCHKIKGEFVVIVKNVKR